MRLRPQRLDERGASRLPIRRPTRARLRRCRRPSRGPRSDASLEKCKAGDVEDAFATPVTNSAPGATAAPRAKLRSAQRQAPDRECQDEDLAELILAAKPQRPAAPTRPPSPMAAFRNPTPVSPMSEELDRRDDEEGDEQSAHEDLRDEIRSESPAPGTCGACAARLAGGSGQCLSTPIPPRASAALSKLIPVTAAAARRMQPQRARWPPRTRSRDEQTGNERADEGSEPSPVLDATFAATSSPGVLANAGRSADWIGRIKDPAPATRAARKYVNSNGKSVATTDAVATAPTARIALMTVSTRSPRYRSTRVVANGPATIPGTTRTPQDSGRDGASSVVDDDEKDDEQRPVGRRTGRPGELDPAGSSGS